MKISILTSIVLLTIIYGVSTALNFAKTNSNKRKRNSTTNPWKVCSAEGQSCSFSGTKLVRYGSNGKYAYQMLTGGVACNNSVFGDPNYGSAKSCEVRQADVVWVKCSNKNDCRFEGEKIIQFSEEIFSSKLSWQKCANENSVCSFSGTKLVRYGAQNNYIYIKTTNSIACNNENFGDPIYGTAKICEFQK